MNKFLVILTAFLIGTINTEAKTPLKGVFVKEWYGKQSDLVAKILQNLDDVPAPTEKTTNFSYSDIVKIYRNHYMKQYGVSEAQADELVEAYPQQWKKVAAPADFYSKYWVWGWNPETGKEEYFHREAHKKGDADGCTVDEMFWLNQATGEIESSDLCGNPIMRVAVAPPIVKKTPPPADDIFYGFTDKGGMQSNVSINNNQSNSFSTSKVENSGNSYVDLTVNLNGAPAAQPVATTASAVYTIPAAQQQQQQIINQQPANYYVASQPQQIVVKQKTRAIDWINTGLNFINTGANVKNAFWGYDVNLHGQPQVMWNGQGNGYNEVQADAPNGSGSTIPYVSSQYPSTYYRW